MRSSPTLGEVLARRKGIGPGFDFLRVALALSVVAWHLMTATGRLEGELTPVLWFAGYGILAMFFGLSGFLISASALRLSLGNFLINRGLRIVPALCVDVILSALILGPIYTALSLTEYFSNPRFWHYFSNVVGWVNYELPGVFTRNPDPAVNNSLWTIPFEIGCYGIISVFVLLGALRRPRLVLAAAVLFAAIGLAIHLVLPADAGRIGYVAERIFTGRGSRLFMSFLLGITAYLFRDRIPYSRWLAGACALLCAGLAAIGPSEALSVPVLNVIAVPALIYLTAFIGVSDGPRLPLFHRGDYSYGIYLYGFPVQQAIVAAFPVPPSVLTLFLLSTPLIVLFAMFSWHAIEKPILAQRRRFSFVAKARLADEETTARDLAAAPR